MMDMRGSYNGGPTAAWGATGPSFTGAFAGAGATMAGYSAGGYGGSGGRGGAISLGGTGTMHGGLGDPEMRRRSADKLLDSVYRSLR